MHSYGAMHAQAAEFLRAHARKSDVLVLAASRGAADDFARAAGERGFLGVHSLTLSHLAAQLAAPELARWELAPVSQLGLEALVARVVHSLRATGKLDYFAPVSDTPGFVRAAASTLVELRMQDVDAGELAATGAPGADLSRLAIAFAEQLQQRALSDQATLYGMALKAVDQRRPHRLLGLPVLLLDPPVRTRRQRALLEAVAGRAPEVLAVAMDADTESIDALEAALGVGGEATEAVALTTLDYIREQIFKDSIEPAPADATVDLFSAPGEGLECVEIARRIRKLAADGVAFDRVAVLVRNADKYQPPMEEALRRAGIPMYFPRGTTRPDPAGRAFLALLACAAEDCSASRFAEYLSLAQVPDLDGAGAPVRKERAFVAASQDEMLAGFQPAEAGEFAPAAEAGDGPVLAVPVGWEQILVDAAVVGGRDRWARRLRGFQQELRLRLSSQDGNEPAVRAGLERRIRQLEVLEGFALPLVELLGSLPRRASWGEWIPELTRLAETALRNPESVLAVLNELLPMEDVGPADLDEVYGVLEARLRFLRGEPPARRYGRVFVSTIDEVRGRRFEVVFLPGLAEGIFPKRAYEDPLLLDQFRSMLAAPLTLKDDQVARERLLLHIAVGCGNRLVVSYPRMDTAQSRPRVPSFYALEVVRAAEGRLPELREFQERAARGAPSRLGWPAPTDPAEAIDDTEFDIATLRRIDDLPAGERRGVGRYLISVNGHLARSLRTRWLRWRQGWSWADGLVDPDAAGKELLRAHRLSERGYSATALQQFAACPYRFLLHAVHQLREREEIAALEQLDPLTRGALFHEAQFEFFQHMKRKELLPVSKEGLRQALDIADQTLDRVAGIYREKLAPAIERVWTSEIEEMRTDLRSWVRHLTAIDDDWMPIHFELGFGLPRQETRDDFSSETEVNVFDTVRLRGSIDLVERHKVMTNVVRVTDHKTGRQPEKAPLFVGGGALLQPVLYGVVAEQLLGVQVAAGRLFYCTQRGGFREIEVKVTPAARQHMQQVLRTIDESIESGFLPAAPQKDGCEYCDYRAVCGPREEERVRKKPQTRLEPLHQIRSLP